MKITSIDVYMGYAIVVKVNTDEGISGFGEAGLQYGQCREAAFGACIDFSKKVIGMDPFNTEEIWDVLRRNTFWGMGGGVVVTSAMAAIDTACWDIKGKKLGVPVYQLIGGKRNKKLRTYASQLQFGWKKVCEANNGESMGMLFDPQEYYDAVKDAVEDGYDAVKIDPVFCPKERKSAQELMFEMGRHQYGHMRKADIDLAVSRIAAAREAGGDNMDIIVEIHSLLDTNTAIALGRALEPYNIMYFEEPTSPENPDNFKAIQQKCNLPLATGERTYTRWGYRPFFENHSLNIIQPDLANTGGITETKKICDMAEVYDIGVQIHVCGGPIATAAALQVEAALSNFVIHEEHCWDLITPYINSCKNYIHPVNGFYEIPDTPGIGQELSEYEMKRSRHVVVDADHMGYDC